MVLYTQASLNATVEPYEEIILGDTMPIVITKMLGPILVTSIVFPR